MPRTNLVINPSLEVNTTGWVASGSGSVATIARSTAQAYSGSACLQVSANSGGASTRAAAFTSTMNVTAGLTYTFSVRTRSAVTSRNVAIALLWNGGSAISGSLTASLGATTTSGWTTYSVTAVAPVGMTNVYAEIGFRAGGSALPASEAHYLDGAMLEVAPSVGTYFDGDTAGCSWTGTAHASTSTQPDPVPQGTGTGSFAVSGSATGAAPVLGPYRMNLLPNPSFEVDTAGWISATSATTLERSTDYAYNSAASLAVRSDGSGDVRASSATGTSGVPAVPNVPYTASFYARGNTADDFVSLFLTFYKANGTQTGSSLGDGDVGGADWKRYEVTATAPADAAYASIAYEDYAHEARTIYIDAAMLERADGYSGGYFDGDSDDCAWIGTPHSSASIYYLPTSDPIPDPSDPATYWADFESGLPTAFSSTVGSVTTDDGDTPGAITTVDDRTGYATHFLQVGATGNNRDDSVTVIANVDTGGGTLEFWHRAWTESGFDFASFAIDGEEQYLLSGKHDWEQLTYELDEGPHTLEWRYTSDTGSVGGIASQRIAALTITNTLSVVAGEAPGDGSGTGTWTFSGDAAGEAPVIPPATGSASGSWLMESLAVGATPAIGFRSGYANGSWSFAGAATSARTSSGAAIGSWAFAGTASSASVSRGSAAGAWTFYGSGRGARPQLPSEVPVNLSSDVRLEVYLSGVWTDITGPTRTISIHRVDSSPGTLTAEVLDADLDPTKASGIRTGRPVRVQVRDGSTWNSLYTGLLDNVSVEYDPLAPEGKQVDVHLGANDNVAFLANQPEVRGVGTINELRWLVAGVPFIINGQSTGLGSGTVVGTNESASLWDQILITRDSSLGYAWVDPDNRLRVYDAAAMETGIRASLTPDIYRSVDVDFALDQIINSVVVNWRRYNIGTETSADVPYGPFEDDASIADWGRRQATFTVQGALEDEAAIAAFAQDVLTRNKDAEVRAKGTVVPVTQVSHISMVRGIDLNSRVNVTLTDGTTVQEQRVTGITHSITPKSWNVELAMSKPLALTPPSQTPSTPYTPIPPGSITEEELHPDVLDRFLSAEQVAQEAIDEALEAIAIADTKAKVFYQPTKPTTGKAADVWFDTDDGYRVYVHNGTDFIDSRDTGIAAAHSAAAAASSAASAADAKAAAAQTAATNAELAANGKSKVTYSPNPPGSAANVAGDVWFQRDGSGTVTGQWEGLGGTTWAPRTLSSATIASLDAGKIIAGSSFTQSLNVKALFTLGDAAVNGVIESYNYDAASTGVRISKSGIFAKGGSLTGALVQTDAGSNGLKLTSAGLTARDPAGNLKLQFDTASGGLVLNGPVTTGGSITGTSVTASSTGVIQTESANSRGIKMNSAGLVAYDSRPGSPTLGQAMLTVRTDLGSIAMKGDLASGSNITGANITGSTFQTSGSSRVELAGSQIKFYAAGNLAGTILAGSSDVRQTFGLNELWFTGQYCNMAGTWRPARVEMTGTLDMGNQPITRASSVAATTVDATTVNANTVKNPGGILSITGGYQLNGGGEINGGPILNGNVRLQNRPATASTVPNMRLDTSDGTIKVTTHANSSLRYKEQVEDLELTDAQLFGVRPVRYRLKANPEQGEQWGFIAEEMEELELSPLLGYDSQDRPNEVDYAKTVVIQQAAIRSLHDTVNQLEQRLAALESK